MYAGQPYRQGTLTHGGLDESGGREHQRRALYNNTVKLDVAHTTSF